MAAGEAERTDPADRAVVLLQRVRELLIECRAVATQLEVAPGRESQAAAAERIAYGVLVAALEEGLVTTLQHAMDVLRRFIAPAGVPRQASAVEPAPIELAELGVAVAVGVLLQVLEVQQLEGDAGLAPLGVQGRAVGDRPMLRRRCRRPVQAGLQRLVTERLDLQPVQPGGAGPALDAGDGPQAGPELPGHLPVATPQGPLLSQDLADLPHG